jgi:hypothetical protein
VDVEERVAELRAWNSAGRIPCYIFLAALTIFLVGSRLASSRIIRRDHERLPSETKTEAVALLEDGRELLRPRFSLRFLGLTGRWKDLSPPRLLSLFGSKNHPDKMTPGKARVQTPLPGHTCNPEIHSNLTNPEYQTLKRRALECFDVFRRITRNYPVVTALGEASASLLCIEMLKHPERYHILYDLFPLPVVLPVLVVLGSIYVDPGLKRSSPTRK